MILVPISLYSAHIRRASQSFERLILPRSDSLPGRVVLCAKHTGEPGTWSVWSVAPGPTSFGLLGRLAGWWNPRLPVVPLDLAGERRIDWHYSCRWLPLHEGWIVSHHPHLPYIRPNLGPDLFCVASAAGPELRRVWAINMRDPLIRGVDPGSIEAGKRSRIFTPQPDTLVDYYPGQPLVRLSQVAAVVQEKLK